MPEDLYNELINYIDSRDQKIKQLKDQGIEVNSEMLEEEKENLGMMLKPKVD